MLKNLIRARDRFLGIGEADISVPIFDGPLKPNNGLESAEVFLECEALDDMCIDASGQLFISAGNAILRASSAAQTEVVVELPEIVQALASFGGGIVAATRTNLFFIGGQWDGKIVNVVDAINATCINALRASPNGTLLISDGSQITDYLDWSKDLLGRECSGRLLEYFPDSGKFLARRQKLAYCYGVCADENRILLSESWAHRVLVLEGDTSYAGIQELPGYPSRITPASGGGFWLTVFAPRSQLLEFVLRENAYRQEMMATIEPKYWIAPAYGSGQNFLEPLQYGGVRQMGILKPWAPARSYGLIVRLGQDLLPRYSIHSRVGGRHHGITAALEFGDALLALSKGSNRILRISLAELESGVAL